MASRADLTSSRQVPLRNRNSKSTTITGRNGFQADKTQEEKHRAGASEILHSIQRLVKTASTCHNVLSAIHTGDLAIATLGAALGGLGGIARLFNAIIVDALSISVTAYIVVGAMNELFAVVKEWSESCAKISLALSDIVRNAFEKDLSPLPESSDDNQHLSTQLLARINLITESIQAALIPINDFTVDVSTPYEDLRSEAKRAFDVVLRDFRTALQKHEAGGDSMDEIGGHDDRKFRDVGGRESSSRSAPPAGNATPPELARQSRQHDDKTSARIMTPVSNRSPTPRGDGSTLCPAIHDEAAEKLAKSEARIHDLESELSAARSEIQTLQSKLSDQSSGPIKFRDALNRVYSLPWSKCQNWTDMEHLITQAHQHDEELSEQVQLRRYDLIVATNVDKQIIFRQWWHETVKPGMHITMSMWSSQADAAVSTSRTRSPYRSSSTSNTTTTTDPSAPDPAATNSTPATKISQLLAQHALQESILNTHTAILNRLLTILRDQSCPLDAHSVLEMDDQTRELRRKLDVLECEIVLHVREAGDERPAAAAIAEPYLQVAAREKDAGRVSTTARWPSGEAAVVGGKGGEERGKFAAHCADG